MSEPDEAAPVLVVRRQIAVPRERVFAAADGGLVRTFDPLRGSGPSRWCSPRSSRS